MTSIKSNIESDQVIFLTANKFLFQNYDIKSIIPSIPLSPHSNLDNELKLYLWKQKGMNNPCKKEGPEVKIDEKNSTHLILSFSVLM